MSAKYSISIRKRAFKKEGTWVPNISERHPEGHDSSLFLMCLYHIFQMVSNPAMYQLILHASIFINKHLCRVMTPAFYKSLHLAWPCFWALLGLAAASDHLLKLNLAANVSNFFPMEKKKCQRAPVCKQKFFLCFGSCLCQYWLWEWMIHFFPLLKVYLIMAPAKCKPVALSLHVCVYLMFFLNPLCKQTYKSLYNCFKGPFLGFWR